MVYKSPVLCHTLTLLPPPQLHVCGGGLELRGGESFLLNLPATVGLLLSAVMLVTVSSSALYLYGYQKFTQFVARSRQRYHITVRTTASVYPWRFSLEIR